MKVTDDVDKLLAQFPAEVQVTALKTRDLVLKTIPKAIEIADPSAKVIGYGFGSGYKDLICTVMLSKNGVKLGIAHGAALPDPEGVLEGRRTRRNWQGTSLYRTFKSNESPNDSGLFASRTCCPPGAH